ncbi:HNH endonuclease [uncultured Clostridium sp.]|jgi:5-methylcytosine-specific restriction protein A|uniref:HNH endonuclease n=1 Tax=uncultured Clostridium sp. TaxID=59620 RepID=UPI0025FFADD7|nr:HNH endonuclease [uncultured Clostridium sp.]
MARLKSCGYCGKIHSTDIVCPKKPVRNNKYSSKGDLRNTYRWRKKREDIKDRDNHVCQVCIRKDYFNPTGQYEFEKLQVHHIEPYKDNEELFYDEDNLITLCIYHHERAEEGSISKQYLKKIARKNNER